MRINIKGIIDLNTKLNNTISDYYYNVINEYKQLENIEYNWHDSNTLKFLNKVQYEKKVALRTYEELNSILGTYNNIIQLYSNFGNEIEINLENIPNIISKLNKCIDKIKIIIIKIENIDINFFPEIKKSYNELTNNFKSMLKKIELINDDIRNTYKKICSNEKEIARYFSKIDIEKFKGELL